MPDFSKGKIYEIVCNITGERYVGSTTTSLAQRKAGHKDKHNTTASRPIIDRGDYSVNLLENYPCNSSIELRQKEREWYEQLECVNQQLPYRSKEECLMYARDKQRELYNGNPLYKEKKLKYYKDNAERYLEHSSKHYADNKDAARQYYTDNKVKILNYGKEWRAQRKADKIKAENDIKTLSYNNLSNTIINDGGINKGTNQETETPAVHA